MRFGFDLPTRIVFGRGRLLELGELARVFGPRALIVTGRRSMRANGALGRAQDSLENSGLQVEVFEGVSPDPRSDEVDAAIAQARAGSSTLVIGLGGGSAIDAAKAVVAGLAHGPGPVGALVGRTLEPHPAALPLIAVPSTAGTGSEVSRGSIVTDIERNFKSGIRGSDLAPRIALVDAELSETTPLEVAIETGFDALTHAIETYVGRRANPIGIELSERSLRLLGPALQRLAAGDRSEEVGDALALAALLGGINVGTSGSCLPHRLQQAMGVLSHVKVPHARGLATLYPAWLPRVRRFAQHKFARIAHLLGGGDIEEFFAQLLPDLGLNARLSSWGVVEDDLDRIVASVSGDMRNDPIENPDNAALRALLADAF